MLKNDKKKKTQIIGVDARSGPIFNEHCFKRSQLTKRDFIQTSILPLSAS